MQKEIITKNGCIGYLKSWIENLHDCIGQGDPKSKLYEEQILFLKKSCGRIRKIVC